MDRAEWCGLDEGLRIKVIDSLVKHCLRGLQGYLSTQYDVPASAVAAVLASAQFVISKARYPMPYQPDFDTAEALASEIVKTNRWQGVDDVDVGDIIRYNVDHFRVPPLILDVSPELLEGLPKPYKWVMRETRRPTRPLPNGCDLEIYFVPGKGPDSIYQGYIGGLGEWRIAFRNRYGDTDDFGLGVVEYDRGIAAAVVAIDRLNALREVGLARSLGSLQRCKEVGIVSR